MRLRLPSVVVVVVVVVTMAGGGCGSCGASAAVTPAGAADAGALGQAIVARANGGGAAADDDDDAAFAAGAFALDVGVDRAAAPLEAHDWRAWFRKMAAVRAAKKALRAAPPAPMTILGGLVTRGLRVDVLRTRKRGEDATVLLHYADDAAGGVGYLELVVAEVDGRARVIDWISSSTCVSSAAQTLETGLGTVDAGETNAFKRMTGGVDAVAAMNRLVEAVKTEQWQAALAAYDAMPARLQDDRAILQMRWAAAQHVSPAATVAAARALRDHVSDDECRALLSIDIARHDGDSAAAAAAVDALDEAVGGDPWLAPLRARFAPAEDAAIEDVEAKRPR